MSSLPAHPASGESPGGPIPEPDAAASKAEPKPALGRFAPAELEAVLKRYDLGRVDSIREFIRGSAQAPKVVVGGPYGKFLIKRRAPGEDHPYQVAYCHALQLHLSERGFPAPALVGTRDDNNSMLQMDGRVYEVSEFIEGDPFDRSPDAARAAGAMLSRFHSGTRGFHCALHTPADFAHGDERAEILLDRCLDRLVAGQDAGVVTGAAGEGGRRAAAPDPVPLIDALRSLWRRCVKDLDHAGITAWPRTLQHADWHPGNLVFAGQSVRAVLDYDSCRRGPRLIDLAGGVLHFSIVSVAASSAGTPVAPGATDPLSWPATPDEPRARAFLAGYQGDQAPLNATERAALAPAMAAAMLLESLPPVAGTGGFAGLPGDAFLEMVRRKSQWLMDHAEVIGDLAKG